MKTKAIIRIITAVFIIGALMSGCANTEHISDISIVEGMSIDRNSEGFVVTAQALNLAKSGNASEGISGNVTMNISGRGENISRAIDNASEGLSKKLFFGQNRIVIFGSGIAENHCDLCIDYFIRSSNSQPDVVLCIAQGDPADVLENEEHDAIVPAQALAKMLKNGQQNGFAACVTASDLANLYLDETSDFYLPVIELEGDNTYSGKTAVYDGTRLAAVLDKNETLGFLIMKNKLSGGVLTVNDEILGKTSFEIITYRTKTKARLTDGVPVFSANIKLTLIINEIEAGADRELSNSDVTRLEQEAQQLIAEYCRLAFEACTHNSSDALRIGKHIARHSSSQYNQIKADWKSRLPSSVSEISVQCKCKKINDNTKV